MERALITSEKRSTSRLKTPFIQMTFFAVRLVVGLTPEVLSFRKVTNLTIHFSENFLVGCNWPTADFDCAGVADFAGRSGIC